MHRIFGLYEITTKISFPYIKYYTENNHEVGYSPPSGIRIYPPSGIRFWATTLRNQIIRSQQPT